MRFDRCFDDYHVADQSLLPPRFGDLRGVEAGTFEHQCRVTCDREVVTGIYQPIDPDAYEACAAGRPGWSFLD